MIDYLMKFRKADTEETLLVMVEGLAKKKHFRVGRHINTYRLTAEYYLNNTDHILAVKVLLAADHREQEIREGRIFDLSPMPRRKRKKKA